MKMKIYSAACIWLLSFSLMSGQSERVVLDEQNDGITLLVDGRKFMINGMNWDYFPIGTNFNYTLWDQSDELIKSALEEEMTLLQNMGVNAIRQYTGIPARWIQYIYENYGIYTMLNHSFGRYGLTIDGAWVGNTEYADPKTRELLLKETKAMVEEYRNTPGLLMYLLGNENNYGLFWEGSETEDIPIEERKSTERATAMYKLFNEATREMKMIDSDHPVAMCNGDLLFLEIIVEECPDVDIFGTNMYRGESFGDAFERVKNEYGKPIMFTEFGADAFNARSNTEDQRSQAYYMVENWKEIYAHAAGMGLTGYSIGGFTFQFSDGWWKYGQTENLDIHDANASWANGGYQSDFREGQNNMNEEWFGICAKGVTDQTGLYKLYPRAAYYALKEVHTMDPMATGMNLGRLNNSFATINLSDAVLQARGDKAALESERNKLLRVSRLTAEFSTFNTGGERISTPEEPDPDRQLYPDQLGFDHMQSFYVGVEANPSPNVRASVEFNIVGNVAENPINEIFYENRGRPLTVETDNGRVVLPSVNRIQVYRAEFDWNHELFNLKGFYRTGHYHWGYEGDFFGLYPEANYGPNIDIYNGEAPIGMEIEGKKFLDGLKLAFGPQLWWGANPAILLKYSKSVGDFNLTGIFHEDLEQLGNTASSFAIPQPRTRRATLHIERTFGKLGVDVGGIWSGQPLQDRTYQVVKEVNGTQEVFENKITSDDTWGGRLKLTYNGGKFNWYGQASAQGIVANGGGDWTQTFTGWRLKENGSGNKYNVLTGLTYQLGDFQLAPNFMWQQPIVDPIPGDVKAPGRARNILTDPFVVRGSRETVAAEFLITYDPTPATWMYQWDNDEAEDSELAVSAGFVFYHYPTTQDAAIGISANGRDLFPFPGAPPAADLWEVNTRLVSKLNRDLGFIANVYFGTGQANGSDERKIERVGVNVKSRYKNLGLEYEMKFNDWGPYDYHRDFNQTFPLQLLLDLSLSPQKISWLDAPGTRVGLRGIWRSLDQYSPRYCPTFTTNPAGQSVCHPTAVGFDNGQEWEIMTYVRFNIIN